MREREEDVSEWKKREKEELRMMKGPSTIDYSSLILQ